MKIIISYLCFIIAAHLFIFWFICGFQYHPEITKDAPTFWEAIRGEHSWIHGFLLICDLAVIGGVLQLENKDKKC